MDEATTIATVLEFPVITDLKSANSRLSEVASTFKEIEEVLAVPDNNGDPAYYIINYKDDGFIMLSADDRLEPIRAFSYDKKFPFESNALSSGLITWLSQTSDMIYETRLLNKQQSLAVAQTWKICEIQSSLQIASTNYGGCGRGGGGSGQTCKNSFESVGPLMTTRWAQGPGYNDRAPNLGCTINDPRAPTGCVATAMAQLMKFHEYPSNYNWSNMPDLQGSMETARLMRDIGDAVNMDYSCDGSGANMDDAASAFNRNFGYRYVSYTGFNRDKVISEIKANRPVVLSGFTTESKRCFLLWCSTTYKEGHAWVTDGFRKSVSYSNDCRRIYVNYYLHMNWGWGNSSVNAFYRWNDWSPSTYNFQYKKKMITVRR